MTPEEREEAEKKKRNKPKNVKQSARRLLGYIGEHKVRLIIVALCVILSTTVSVLAALLIRPIYAAIQSVIQGKTTDGPAVIASIGRYLILLAVSYTLSAVFSLLYTRIMLNVSVKTVTKLRRDLFNHLQGLPVGWFDKRKVGEVMSHFTSDVNRVNDLVSESFPTIISSTITAVMTIALMISFSWKITLTLTFAVALMVLTVIVITNKVSPLFKKQQKAIAACNGYIEEYIMGIKAVKVFCYEDRSKARFRELNEEYRRIGVKANIISGFMGPIMSMISRLNYVLAITLGTISVTRGHMDVPTLTTYLSYASGYGGPIVSIAGTYSAMISALAGAERIFEVLDTPFETDEGRVRLAHILATELGWEETEDETGALAWKVPQDDGTFTYVPVKCDVDIKDVNFSYVEDKPVLKHVSAHANSGEKLAFVGSTGAGKTTITNLINRFYEIEDGEITIDGISIKDIKKDDLRHSMAFVLQDSKLFAGTVKENIRYGKLDATDEEIVAAAKLANAHSFIKKLPEGYDTELRADGMNLSAGEAQLINIARAAIANRPLLVLDEATSSVDTRTERKIELGMDQLMKDKTVLVIAHRLSTVRNSDDIIVLENGEVIEQGNHQQLIDLGRKYYQLYTGLYEMT
ncbi:MAG: ABC transporter ATP-binding protein [Clostridia bacterium]|nr:ABC transporter ATP-binding protein [Clostridia bacterium]